MEADVSRLNRRAFLGAAAAPAVLRGQAARRPNILFAIADDHSWLHTSSAGDPVVKTPAIDRVARQGVRFTQAFCSSPSCTPSRGAILSGQDFWRLREGGNLWSLLPKDIEVYPDLLEAAGYHAGHTRKGWGPGNFQAGGRDRNPAGPLYPNFEKFFETVPKDKPFCFWFGSQDPHRPYEAGTGQKAGMRLDDVRVPPWLPDHPAVRADILDYYFEVQRYDREVGEMLDKLQKAGRLDNTLVVVTSDNGMPFPRAKTNLYDSGTRMPLAVMWPERIPGNRVVDDLVGFADFAPTFLEAAGLKPRPAMTGRSLLPLLTSKKQGRVEAARDAAFVGRERHTRARGPGVGYPMRAIRTHDFLYIRNHEPDRWPAGDPETFGDIDGSPTKDFVLAQRQSSQYGRFFEMACAKRPAAELYDLKKDPGQLVNVAGRGEYAAVEKKLAARLDQRLRETGDPRAIGGEIIWDRIPYFGRQG